MHADYGKALKIVSDFDELLKRTERELALLKPFIRRTTLTVADGVEVYFTGWNFWFRKDRQGEEFEAKPVSMLDAARKLRLAPFVGELADQIDQQYRSNVQEVCSVR